MKAVCKLNRGHEIGFAKDNFQFFSQTEFPVIKGKEYIIMGVIIYKNLNGMHYLIDDDRPFWVPSVCFELSDNKVFNECFLNWYIRIFNKQASDGVIFFLSGFDELCNNDRYYEALLERESWALDIYFKRKREMQKWYELKPFMNK